VLIPFQNRDALLDSLRGTLTLWLQSYNSQVNYHDLEMVFLREDLRVTVPFREGLRLLLCGLPDAPTLLDFTQQPLRTAVGLVVVLSSKK
jgi:hypothetical protein